MSKGGVGIAEVDQLAWLASVKVGSKRESHSSETNSRVRSRTNAQSRPPSGLERSGSSIGVRQRSGSLSRIVGDERRDGDELQDEFVSKLPFSFDFYANASQDYNCFDKAVSIQDYTRKSRAFVIGLLDCH
jgi:hypothetical protein